MKVCNKYYTDQRAGMCRSPVAPCFTKGFPLFTQPLGLTLEAGCQTEMISESVMNLWDFLMIDVKIFSFANERCMYNCIKM